MHRYGWYRIMFRLDEYGQVNGVGVRRNVELARLAIGGEEAGEAPLFVPQIRPATNMAWVDIEVTRFTGGDGEDNLTTTRGLTLK
jgi:hypothetical protein